MSQPTFLRLLSERSGVRLSPGARLEVPPYPLPGGAGVANTSAKALRKVFTALLIAGALAFGVSPASASGADPASACSTVEKGRRLVTTIERLGGETDRIADLLVVERAFPGKRDVVKQARRPGARVARCRVMADGTVVLRTVGGARVKYSQPLNPATPHPAAAGAWPGPVTFHSTVSPDWQVAEAVAAWNAALPAGRQLSLQAEPCTVASCIPITSAPTLTDPTWFGEATPASSAGIMTGCSIRVADFTPVKDRAATMAHEIGHCLGLPHWDFKGSVMYAHPDAVWTDAPSRYDLEWLSGTR